MDRLLREERKHILDLCKKIAKSGCNCLLIQKSILRDATNDLTLHYLAKLKIMVVTDVERSDIEFISKTLGCTPIAHIDQFTSDRLGKAVIAEETSLGHEGAKVVRLLTKNIETDEYGEVKNQPSEVGSISSTNTVSILLRGSNKLVLDEAERSLHDALCVVRCLVKNRALISGGGSPEMECAIRLRE